MAYNNYSAQQRRIDLAERRATAKKKASPRNPSTAIMPANRFTPAPGRPSAGQPVPNPGSKGTTTPSTFKALKSTKPTKRNSYYAAQEAAKKQGAKKVQQPKRTTPKVRYATKYRDL